MSDPHVAIEYCFGDINTLFKQETRYQFSRNDCDVYRTNLDSAFLNKSAFHSESTNRQNMNLDWRYRIARWLLTASDELNISRETALIALTYCDRYMMKRHVEKQVYQLASITSLFIASKLFEKRPIKMATLVRYTQRVFPPLAITRLEKDILHWNATFMYPPTACYFAMMFINGVYGSTSTIKSFIENIEFNIQLASCDFYFLRYKPSTVAVASIMIAFEQGHMQNSSSTCFDNIKASGLDINSNEVKECIHRLKLIFKGNQLQIYEEDRKHGDVHRNLASTTTSTPTGRVTPSPTAEIIAKLSGSKRSHDNMDR